MMSLKKLATKLAAAATFLVLSCTQAKEDLVPLDEFSVAENSITSLRGEFCTLPSDAVKSKLKMIIVMDKSGSNQNVPPDNAGTDIDGMRRYAPIKQMLQSYTADPTVFFSLVNFSNTGNVVQEFTNDKDAFLQVIEQQHNPSNQTPPHPNDGGWTNFEDALKTVHNMIDADIKAAKELPEVTSSYYVVFFISDGAPYVNGNDPDDLQDKPVILDLVESILALSEESKMYVDSIQLHTGYYYNNTNPNADAQTYMREMALKGFGDFFEFSAGEAIDFSQFALPTRNVKHVLRDVLLADLNSLWVEGKLYLDSDGDGVPDKTENDFGSNPQKADSDDNGVSDGVEMFAMGKPCKDDRCTPAGAQPFGSCSQWIDNSSTTARYTDLDKDGLNNCEEQVVLKSKIDSFDSNEDWMPDFLGLRNNIAFVAGSQEVQLDPDGDKTSNYNEVKLGTPIKFANDRLMGFKPFKYDLNVVSDDAEHTCYSLEINDIKMLQDVEKFRLFLLENTAIIDTKRFMRTLDVTLRLGETTTFTRDDFGEGREE